MPEISHLCGARGSDPIAASADYQAERGFDPLTYFAFRTRLDAGIDNADDVSGKVRDAFSEFSTWRKSERALREPHAGSFTIYAQEEDMDKLTRLVEDLFSLLEREQRI